MALLRILKGGPPNQTLPLDKPRIVLGREAKDCDLVIPNQAVSRVHAQISLIQGRHYIEDLKSRNKTYVNNKLVETPTVLNDNDRIKICDFLATYQADVPSKTPLPEHFRPEEAEEFDADGPSTIQATIGRLPQQQILETQPADRLRALLEIASTLGKALQLDDLLQKIADTLLTTFRQADRCFVILRDEAAGHLIPRVIKTRRPQADGSPRFSRTIVRNCLESMQAFLSEDASTDSKFSLSQSITDFRILSVMCVPLIVGDKAVGVIQLDSQDRTKKFNKDDLGLLLGVANQASVALENARLHEDLIQSVRFQRDLELGQQVQRSFLPHRLPQVPGYQFYAQYKSALTIGGDYYDFVRMPNGKLGVLLGDVSGKGVPAALLMAKLSAEARFCITANHDPAKAVADLNELLYQLFLAGEMDRFVTLAAAVLDPVTHVVTLVNAGHMAPLILRKSDWSLADAICNDLAGPPLGSVDGMTYESCQIDLQTGDCLLLYTDGVTDATNTLGKAFALTGLRKAVLEDSAAASGPWRPETVGHAIIEAVRRHSSGCAQNDDIALVCFGRPESPSGGPRTTGQLVLD
jgi:serine phosphatase RsbU (regulator of sigma subunit)